jgi:hypothetical protein
MAIWDPLCQRRIRLHRLGAGHRPAGKRFTRAYLGRREKVENAHIHELRAKALTELPDARHAKTLAGHATESMTSHYRKARMAMKVKGVEY